jgi:uncharacterized protein YbaP (TraB family)
MRYLIVATLAFFSVSAFSQKTKVPPNKYPSLLWEISGKGLSKPSYLFGTMHVSSKMVFHLSDSFYLGIKNADVVALETDMGQWQDNFSRYDVAGFGYGNSGRGFGGPNEYLTIGSLQTQPYEKLIEMALYSNPSMINSFLYRTNSDNSVDLEEDTYLDMHIYQAGKKWGKKVCGVENFDRSMELMKEAYIDAAKEKTKKDRSYDYDEDFSYGKLEDAYRTGNLDLLDTINKINSTSAAFDEKFLYKRNEIQANSIDSILRTKQALFVGVGAAHLPGQRGVIELLRRKGYTLRPIKMTERDSKHKDEVEKIRVPVTFSKQTSADGFFTVNLPGKLYDFNSGFGLVDQKQFADMSNGAYYMVTRINTNSILWGHDERTVLRKVDSVLYEYIPGKILTKQSITRNGYKGFDITNRTRRGDFQHYNIFVTPFEIILFKMSGNGDYVKEGAEADQFFNSIEFKDFNTDWKLYSPSFGGFQVQLPHEPVIVKKDGWQFAAVDKQTNTGFEIIRTDIHNYNFVEEDSFDLNLMEESFASSDFIEKQLSAKQTKTSGYASLDAKYKYKDGSLALVRFIIQGPHYYTLVAHGKSETPKMTEFLNSFAIKSFVYDESKELTDTVLHFTVTSPVPLEKPKKLSMYPENLSRYGYYGNNDEDAEFLENGESEHRIVSSDSTGEKIYVTFYKPSRYYYNSDTAVYSDSSYFNLDRFAWKFRYKNMYELPDQMKVLEYVIGDPKSSRYIIGKSYYKNGITYNLETEGDSTTKESAFITSFFETFKPSDTLTSSNPAEKKAKIFFQDFFSTDTALHRKAVVNVDDVEFDSTDFPKLKTAIQSLSWNHRKYMNVKNDFVWQLGKMKSNEAADYLKDIYYAAGDTIELQYTALESLLNQKTSYAYQLFKNIMVDDPPVLDVSSGMATYRPDSRKYLPSTGYYNDYVISSYDYDEQSRGQSFFASLYDSAQLTSTIIKDLLPLMNIDDYERPIMDLMGTLIDSGMLAAKDYEMYETKFLIEAKQALKKQVISEKNKSIKMAQNEDDDQSDYANEDYGNSELSLYATLLMPFWDKNPAIPQLMNQMLRSEDKRLKYNTTMLLLRNNKAVPDTMLNYFAKLDDYRYELFVDLKQNNRLELFPAAFSGQVDLAKSQLLRMTSSYNKPDSIVFVDKLPVQHKERTGYVFFFKYKSKKDDNVWKLATVGIIPSDPKSFQFERKKKYWEEAEYDFTNISTTKIEKGTPLKDQLKKELKKIQYSKRNSAAEFYRDEDGVDLFSRYSLGNNSVAPSSRQASRNSWNRLN